MKKFSLILFMIISLGELLSSILDLSLLHSFCKPAIIPGLLLYYIFSQRSSRQSISLTLVMALIFSGVGDVMLMKEGELFFMLGLGSFLIAHVFYIFTFRQFRLEDDTNALQGVQRFRFAFPIILFGTGLVVILYPQLGALEIPVVVYALVLTVMVINSLFRYNRTTTSSFVFVFAGAILFMISDSLLAVNKFLEPVMHAGFWIMICYISAQFLIVKGLIQHRD